MPFFTWGHMVGQGKRRVALGSINKLAAKMIVPIRHTTPRHSLEVIFDLMPLDIQGTYEALASLTRQELALTQTWIGTNPKYSTYIGHRKYWYDMRNELLGYSLRISDREKGILTNKNYTVDTKSMNNKTPVCFSFSEFYLVSFSEFIGYKNSEFYFSKGSNSSEFIRKKL